MALKQVILSYEIRAHNAEKEKLERARQELDEKREALKKRETTLTEAVNELPADADEATKEKVLAEVEKFEEEVAALEQETEANTEKINEHTKEIEKLQAEIDAMKPESAPADPPAEERSEKPYEKRNERMYAAMKTRALSRLSVIERAQLIQREDVTAFLERAKSIITRAVTNANVTIPTVLLPMIREEVEKESKLLKHVHHQTVPGEARIPVMGEIPEAIWTQQCAKLNELDLSMYLVEMDAFKVSGFYAVCRYMVEDSAENLLDEILFALARGIAIALDKAIVFGTGAYMPMGIATRILQTSNPGGAGQYARPWVDLHEKNVHSINQANSTGAKLVSGIISALSNTKKGVGQGLFFAMNAHTKMRVVAELLNYNANGALVTGIGNQMPAVGGDIEELDFMPDGLIVAGYGKNYAAIERGAISFDANDSVKWIEEQTLVKGTARYDGKPVQPAAFTLIGIDGVAPATAAATVKFAGAAE